MNFEEFSQELETFRENCINAFSWNFCDIYPQIPVNNVDNPIAIKTNNIFNDGPIYYKK